MKLALFLGCQIPARLMQYEAASRAVVASLGLDVADIEEFNCCGYPLRNISFKACILLSARNLALAERKQRDIVSLCQCCFGTLAKVNRMLQEDSQLRNEINETLEQEGLTYKGSVQVKHLLQVLYHDVGVDALRERVKRRYEGLRVATHYGCHVLRPSSVVQFDDPVNPTLFDRLVEVTGARSVQWPMRLECCGAPLRGINDELSTQLTTKKIEDGKRAGSQCLCVACPYCHIQFETVQDTRAQEGNGGDALPVVLYPQLLGLCLGIGAEQLGLDMNKIRDTRIEESLVSGGGEENVTSPTKEKEAQKHAA